MTYQDALKERARLAYGQIKTAATDASPNAQETMAIAHMFGAQNARQQEADAVAAAADELARSQEQGHKDKIISHYGYGSGLGGVTMEDEMDYDDRNRKGIAEQKRIDDARIAQRNLNYGIGAGALGGLAVGAGAYGLAGLFPSLRKRRLLRALIALGAGAAGGTAIGYGVNKGLNSGAIQGAYGKAKDKAVSAYNTGKSRVGGAIAALKGGEKAEA